MHLLVMLIVLQLLHRILVWSDNYIWLQIKALCHNNTMTQSGQIFIEQLQIHKAETLDWKNTSIFRVFHHMTICTIFCHRRQTMPCRRYENRFRWRKTNESFSIWCFTINASDTQIKCWLSWCCVFEVSGNHSGHSSGRC